MSLEVKQSIVGQGRITVTPMKKARASKERKTNLIKSGFFEKKIEFFRSKAVGKVVQEKKNYDLHAKRLNFMTKWS